MANWLVTAVVLLATWGLTSRIMTMRRNYQLALSSGFPTFISPVHISDAWWMMLYPVLLPVFEMLPNTWTKPWLTISKVWRIWKSGYQPFEEAKSDTFILSTPKDNTLWTCDHAVIHDLLNQHPRVDVPSDILGFYDIWGPTIGSVHGEQWKPHRKAVAAGFSTSMNQTIWRESQRQTLVLIEHWSKHENSTVSKMRDWTSRLALHVISNGFFNMSPSWDEPELDIAQKSLQSPRPQQKLPFDKALILLMKRLSTIYVVPRVLLGKLPGITFQEANLALTETERYITEQKDAAEANVEAIMKKRNPTLLEAIVASGNDPAITDRAPFMKKGILGNLFFTLMAGHETVGSSLGFIFVLAAIYPDVQQHIQAQLDSQLGNRSIDQWTLEQDYPALQKGYIGAVQKEILSIYHPASFLLRRVIEPVTVTDSNGISHDLPAGMLAMSNLSAAFKNPKVWDRSSTKISPDRRAALGESPALYFNPGRWLDNDGNMKSNLMLCGKNREVLDWWAFGQGPRICPGKAFAQIETTSAMATLFKHHTLELIVDEATIKQCGGDKNLAWEKTRDAGIKKMYDGIEANLTISLASEVPIRVVPR